MSLAGRIPRIQTCAIRDARALGQAERFLASHTRGTVGTVTPSDRAPGAQLERARSAWRPRICLWKSCFVLLQISIRYSAQQSLRAVDNVNNLAGTP